MGTQGGVSLPRGPACQLHLRPHICTGHPRAHCWLSREAESLWAVFIMSVLYVGDWVRELSVFDLSSPDVCPRGAVHRGHCGAGAADVPRAGDPGTALHFPGGLSVLWRCAAVRHFWGVQPCPL